VFLKRLRLAAGAPASGYPFDLAAVRSLPGLEFAPVTVLVGDNGTGKSTIVEALAVAAGFNAEGGGRNLRFATHGTHSSLHEHLELVWAERPRWGWFLRAETFYGLATHVETDGPFGVRGSFPALHDESHGESFLDLALGRFGGRGLYLLDEPESALSLTGQLTLLRLMYESVGRGSQFVLATHSPVLMAYPGALAVELDGDGLTVRPYDDLAPVQLWRRFLADPRSLLDELLA
jgi:predicted ATPase